MSITKKPYEISLWDEQLYWHRRGLQVVEIDDINIYERGKYYVQNESQDTYGITVYELDYDEYNKEKVYYELMPLPNPLENIEGQFFETDDVEQLRISLDSGWYNDGVPIPQVISSYYKEIKLFTIGSSTMDSLSRCVNPKLISKVNGENTLTFTMYYQYIDTETGEKTYNPFIKYMTNERKVKLKYDGKWYDFVIKQIQENSDTKAFTYTCKDQFVNELSKTGFDLVLDNELENNMGTVVQLAETILEGSDWRIDKDNTQNLKQFIEEPLYKIQFTSINYDNTNNPVPLVECMEPIKEQDTLTLEKLEGQYIYVFYSHINDQVSDLQFLYTSEEKFSTDDKLVIDKDKYSNYLLKGVKFNILDENGNIWPNFTKLLDNGLYNAALTSDYRGMRLVRQIQTKYDSTIDKFVKVYKRSDDNHTLYYGFTETKYLSPKAVTNYIVNSSGFTNTTGWRAEEGGSVEITTNPPVTSQNWDKDTLFTSYLKFETNGARLINSSVNSFKSSLGDWVENETTYVLRIKLRNNVSLPTNFAAAIRQYEYDTPNTEDEDKLFDFVKFEKSESLVTNETTPSMGYYYFKAVCKKTISETDLQKIENKYALFLYFGNSTVEIEDIQLFPYLMDGTKLCVPGGELFSKIETIERYYVPNNEYTSVKDVNFEPPLPDNVYYVLQYNEGADAYTKIVSITAKESNRFNLLQDLNEKFECWAHFNIKHNEDGSIKLGKDKGILTGDEAYRQQKFVSFREYAGQPNPVGFKYGVNSKSIQRNIESNAIVSKLIVKDNANEFAQSGFCSIARATENPTKENFLLNFDYYVRQQLLNINVVTNDLYLDSNGYLGYYKKLKRINQDREAKIEQQANLLTDIINYQASFQTYKVSYDSAAEERLNVEAQILDLLDQENESFEAIIKNSTITTPWANDKKFKELTTKWAQLTSVMQQHKPLYEKAESYLKTTQDQYDEIDVYLKEIADKKRALNLQFYKKYSRFIQEGSWIKEDYVDDNLYYLDSISTLQVSSQPKITYTINVLELSQLLGYEVFNFNIGDITYIEDKEFFGYSLIDGRTPYKEEIIVSEISLELDSPEKNSIKVQNYKSQFEDLFQRIAAQTQQAEYHTGEYNRVASIVESNGTLTLTTLENSFANNSLKLQNARDQSVVIDEYGITSTSLSNPSEMVRIVAGGIFMSTDGGQSWKTGVTGSGINTSYLTSGQINTNEIYIMNGNNAAFRWDEKGLAAYYKDGNTYNTKKFVRFDHNGIYGVVGEDNWVPVSFDDIKSKATFGLTWDNFFLKKKYGEGYVSISSEDDFVVNDGTHNRIKIGNLGSLDEPQYGIRISNNSGKVVMETDDSGGLWLKNKLQIETYNNKDVSIGKLDSSINTENQQHGSRVFDANGDFIIYEDGHIIANSGKIGSLDISNIQNLDYEVQIVSDKGLLIRQGDLVTLEAKVYYKGEEIFSGEEYSISYQWYRGNSKENDETSNTYQIENINFGTDNYEQYSCEVDVSQN